MPPALLIPARVAPWLSLCGLVLLLGAWPLAQALPLAHAQAVYGITLAIWAASIAACVFFCPAQARRRCGLALVSFAVLALSADASGYAPASAQTLGLLGLILLALGLWRWPSMQPPLARLGRALRHTQAVPPWLFIAACCAMFLGATLALFWHCSRFLPIIDDSIAQYVHAKFMAAGHLYGELPPLRQFFPVKLMIDDGKWYSAFQPLQIALLALGHLAHAPWLVNPLKGVLTLAATYALARRVYDEPTARIAALLMLGSQFVLFMSTEYLSHAAALLFTMLFLLCYAALPDAARDSRKAALYGWALGAGLSLGCVFLTRPLTMIGIGLPFMAHALYRLWRAPRVWIAPALIMASGLVACFLIQAWFNVETTGDAFLSAYMKYRPHHSHLGFDDGYTVLDGLIKAQHEWVMMNGALFEWPLPSTLFVLPLCLLPVKRRFTRLLLAMICSYTVVNMANQWNIYLFGPRFIYETSGALILLTAVAIRRLSALPAARRLSLPQREAAGGMLAVALAALFCSSLAFRLPANLHAYTHPRNSELYFSLLAQSAAPALIFIDRRPMGDPKKNKPGVKYEKLAFANPPDSRAPVIFAIDRGKENRALMEYYPDRHAYLERDGRLYPITPGPSPYIGPAP